MKSASPGFNVECRTDFFNPGAWMKSASVFRGKVAEVPRKLGQHGSSRCVTGTGT